MEVMIEPHKYAEAVGADALHAFFPTVLRQMGGRRLGVAKKFVLLLSMKRSIDLLKQVG